MRGPLVASIDLDNRANWLRTSGIERIPPALLNCRNSDPQIEFACPAALTHRLSGTCMEIDVELEGDGKIQVFWDLGAGWSEELSESRSLNAGTRDRQMVRVSLPPGVVGLRVDPLDRPGRVTLHSIGFYAAEPAGARLFPFDALRTTDPGAHSWIDLPEVQQIVSHRMMGDFDDWPEWVFTRLIGAPVRRCLHLGATNPSFGTLVVESGYVDEYIAVPRLPAPDGRQHLSPIAGVRWLSPEQAAGSAPFDLVLSTGYFSSGERDRPSFDLTPFTPAAVVLLERFRLDPAAQTVLARYLRSSAEALPPGWALERHTVEPGHCRLDDRFQSMFECHEVRPMGGTLVEPLFERLPKDFYVLGAFTMLGTLSATYLLLEETLIQIGILPSTWNLVAATPRTGRALKLLRPPLGWSVRPTASVDATSVSAEGVEALARLPPLAERTVRRTPADAAVESEGASWLGRTFAEIDRRGRSYLRRTLRRMTRGI